jgi:hypothetical protein
MDIVVEALLGSTVMRTPRYGPDAPDATYVPHVGRIQRPVVVSGLFPQVA